MQANAKHGACDTRIMSPTRLSATYREKSKQVIRFLVRIRETRSIYEGLPKETQTILEQAPSLTAEPEEVDWPMVINILKSIYTAQVRRPNPTIEYFCLLLEEELLQHIIREEELRLILQEKRSAVLHALDQAIYKASCLFVSLQTENPAGARDPSKVPTSNAVEFMALLKEAV